MNIELRMFMKFKEYLPSDASNGKAMISLKDGSTFGDLLKKLGVPLEEPKLVLINGVSQGVTETVNQAKLKNGDIVAVFPPAAGG